MGEIIYMAGGNWQISVFSGQFSYDPKHVLENTSYVIRLCKMQNKTGSYEE